jgi:hypothetical protein
MSQIMQPSFMSKQIGIVVLLMMVSALAAGCKSSQTLSYEVLLSYVPLETEPPSEKAPGIIVIASIDEIVPPAKGVKYPQVAMDLLANLDYSKYFAILFIVGQVKNDNIVDEVIRERRSVTIELNDYSIGPGNYEVPGFTLPYQLIVIEKSGTWGEDVHFEIRVDQTDIIREGDHYIP